MVLKPCAVHPCRIAPSWQFFCLVPFRQFRHCEALGGSVVVVMFGQPPRGAKPLLSLDIPESSQSASSGGVRPHTIDSARFCFVC